MDCPTCHRDCPDSIMENHHLRTRREDKHSTEKLCRECHKAIHGLFTNKELADPARNLDTVDGLMADERFYRAVKHIRTIPPGAYMKMRESRSRRRKKGRR